MMRHVRGITVVVVVMTTTLYLLIYSVNYVTVFAVN